ncbi:hypothetical protein pb186bvf_006668 [Paramecium bursaria]
MNIYTLLLMILWWLNISLIGYLSYFAYKPIYIIFGMYLQLNLRLNISDQSIMTYCRLENAYKYTQIVYSDDYNFRACGLENLHKFDATKYHKIASSLAYETTEPFYLSRHMLLELGMSQYYLLSLCYSIKVSLCVEVPLFFSARMVSEEPNYWIPCYQLHLEQSWPLKQLSESNGLSILVEGFIMHHLMMEEGKYLVQILDSVSTQIQHLQQDIQRNTKTFNLKKL